jgi:hypothetical protein
MWLHPENNTEARTLGRAEATAGDVDARQTAGGLGAPGRFCFKPKAPD